MAPTFLPLPPYVFLMSDHTTHERAVELAGAIAEATNGDVVIEDFLSPIHEAIHAMFDFPFAIELGKGNYVLARDKPVGDLIKDLEKWFIEHFDEFELGRMALERCREHRETTDAPTVFRDATEKHLKAFIDDKQIPRSDILIVRLKNGPRQIIRHPNGVRELFTDTDDVNEIVEQIRKAVV